MSAPVVADGTMSATVWPTHLGIGTPEPAGDYQRAQIHWELVADQPVGHARIWLPAGDYTDLVYAHAPAGVLSVSHTAPLPHPLHWPKSDWIDITNISPTRPQTLT